MPRHKPNAWPDRDRNPHAWTLRRMEQLAWLAHSRETAGLRLVERALIARGAGRAQAIAEAQQEQREANRAWLISVMVLLGGAW